MILSHAADRLADRLTSKNVVKVDIALVDGIYLIWLVQVEIRTGRKLVECNRDVSAKH